MYKLIIYYYGLWFEDLYLSHVTCYKLDISYLGSSDKGLKNDIRAAMLGSAVSEKFEF